MNYSIKEETTESRLPEVGELWTHRGLDGVFMRIDDDSGRELGFPWYDRFYSIDIEDGRAMWTPFTETSIIILHPVGGTLELEVKR